jgi:hypothetical protein
MQKILEHLQKQVQEKDSEIVKLKQQIRKQDE